ncbi:hypothetical protein N474_05245 [Pseudoalteromonas luteoviolacea CPMOR-2]|uniref:Uncharacterized protein n=1 Tax=Pseudoalteromonas luteoviolacea DSM 6061 TaxID=1365250 RepID=A0A166WLT9_9GAMM|nr:hypothetical protein [Pseudoalteromonas luteoviolacea]KZN37633.1 hypothetical protein N475_02155 [Pseudoalteromonas luteoviolacea DSM 6061]KZN49659.1 hypothetical protein N474_05245 [Pseudoalteromonas luteoviolacea CPMOR-2]MBE0386943.1 hypothetical protein [Pseudoalteromonas luteoviolacea DSM 6061]
MSQITPWSPIQLKEECWKIINQTKNSIELSQGIDTALANQVINISDCLIAENLDSIVERDGLPHLCHVINGWGNLTYQGNPLTDLISGFVHFKKNKQPYIYQCDPEGDFHPWQTFAYSAMAGVPATVDIAQTGITFADLLNGSTQIMTNKGVELGHMLFALANYYPHINARSFTFYDPNGTPQEFDIEQLMVQAVHAHYVGDYTVCRKFHLTEGVLAMVAKVPGLEKFKPYAQLFLTSQLEILHVLLSVLRLTVKLVDNPEDTESKQQLDQLRNDMVMSDLIENQVYYAGHVIEVMGFAMLDGFEVDEKDFNCAIEIVNTLNKILKNSLHQVDFQEAFLGLGHYRRAQTLLSELINSEKPDLTAYIATLDNLQTHTTYIDSTWDVVANGIFSVHKVQKERPEKFLDIVEKYNTQASENWQTRGSFMHFRRIAPSHWPRACHYEFLTLPSAIGVEIHLERDELAFIKPYLKQTIPLLRTEIQNYQALDWDEEWNKGRGRLFISFSEQTSTDIIVAAMQKLIELTQQNIETLLTKHCMTAA